MNQVKEDLTIGDQEEEEEEGIYQETTIENEENDQVNKVKFPFNIVLC